MGSRLSWTCVLVAFLALPAQAAQRRVGVIVVGSDAGVAGRMQSALESELSGQSWTLVTGAEVAAGLGAGADDPRQRAPAITSDVDRAMEKALSAYFDLDYAQALEDLDGADQLLARAPHRYFRRRVQAHLLRAATYFAQGQNSGARREADAALLLDGNIEPDLDRFPPPFWNMVGEQRRANPQIEVTFTGLPDGAELWIDGRKVGEPFGTSVTRGRHWLAIRAPRYQPLEDEIELHESETRAVGLAVKLSEETERALEALVRDGAAYRDSTGLRAKARSAKLDVVVVGLAGNPPEDPEEDPVRRVVVWRMAGESEASVDVRPTDGVDRFDLGAIQTWTLEHVKGALAQTTGSKEETIPPVAASETRRLSFAVDGSMLYAVRERAVGYSAGVGGTDYVRVKLTTQGPGWQVTGRGLLTLGPGSMALSLKVRQLLYVLEQTQFRNAQDPSVLSPPVGGGIRTGAYAGAGYVLHLLRERLDVGVGLAFQYEHHEASDIEDDFGPLRVFTGYDRSGIELGAHLGWRFPSWSLGAQLELYGPESTEVTERPEPTLGTAVNSASGAALSLTGDWTLGQTWRLRGGLGYERHVYRLTGSSISRLEPTPRDPLVEEADLIFSFTVRRMF